MLSYLGTHTLAQRQVRKLSSVSPILVVASLFSSCLLIVADLLLFCSLIKKGNGLLCGYALLLKCLHMPFSYVSMCVWRPVVDIRCLLQLTFTFIVKHGVSKSPKRANFVSWPASPRELSVCFHTDVTIGLSHCLCA